MKSYTDEILNNWDELYAANPDFWVIPSDDLQKAINEVLAYLSENKINEGQQVKNYVKFFITVPKEYVFKIWSKLSEKGAEDQTTVWNITKTHKREVIKRMFEVGGWGISEDDLNSHSSIYDL